MDLNDIIDYLRMVARSVGAEISSPFFYLQFGLILTAAGIALAANAALQARVNTDSLANRWPLPLRRLAHVLVESFSTVVFAVLVIAARITMYHSTWPSRSYMLVVAAKLALAWLVIRLVTSVVRNAFLVKLISVSAWVIAALSIINQLGRIAADAAGPDQARPAFDRRPLAHQCRQQLCRKPDQSVDRPDAVDSGAAGEDDPDGVTNRCDRRCARCRRYQPVRAGGVFGRGRRRHRHRPAKDCRQLHQRHHPFGGQVG